MSRSAEKNHVPAGILHSDDRVKYVRPSDITTGSAHAAKDVITSFEIPDVAEKGGTFVLQSITVLDGDDSGSQIDFHFFRKNPSGGITKDSAIDLTMGELHDFEYQGSEKIETGDYYDLASSQVANKGQIGKVMQCHEKSSSIWCAIVTQGTPTFANGDDLNLGFGILPS